MSVQKPDEEAIKEEAKNLLNGGASRQEVYEQLTKKYIFGKTVADIVRYLPSKEAKLKYGAWNIILLMLLISTLGVYMLFNPSLGVFVWYTALIIAVGTMQFKYYMWISILATIGLFFIIAKIAYFEGRNINWANVVLVTGLNLPCTVLPFWLEKKLCPAPSEKKEKYTNSQGQQRMRIVYRFRDI